MLMYPAGIDRQIFTKAFIYTNSLFMHASKTPTCLRVCACSHEPSMWYMYNVIMTCTKISPTNVTVNSKIIARAYFRETTHVRSFVKMKSSRNREVTLSITDIGKPCPSREILTSLVCLLTLFAKIKFSRKFPDLRYQNSIKKQFSMFYSRNDIMQKVLMG